MGETLTVGQLRQDRAPHTAGRRSAESGPSLGAGFTSSRRAGAPR